MVQLSLCLCLKHYPAPLENPTTCFYFLSRWCTCSYQLHPLSLPPSLPPTPPPPRHLSLQVWLQYPERTAPLSTLPRSPLRQSPHWLAEPVGLAQLLVSCLLTVCVLLLLLLPGVNLRRREKKTYPSLSSVRGPLPICLHFPPRRHHWLPCRASQLASFPSPSWAATARKHLAAAEC